MGSSKDHFCNFRVLLPGSWKYFCEYLRASVNFFKSIWGCYSGAYVLLIHGETWAQKSHATVPLKHAFCQVAACVALDGWLGKVNK